jgi:PAS domain S-box-containing protein
MTGSGPRESLHQHEALDRWFHTLFESSPDSFVLIDSTGTVAAASPPIESLLGHAPRDLVGSPAAQILPALDLAATHLEVDARHRNGAIVPVEIVITPLAADDQRWVLARVGARSPRGSEVSPATLSAELLSVLMHELRTPLQTMLGWAQHLRAAPRDPATLDQGLTTIERNIRWQAEVLEDLIEKAQLVSGQQRLDLRTTRVRALIESAIERVAASASAKGVRLVWIPTGVDYEIAADALCLGRMLGKLLANAIRFTSPSGVVAIRLQRQGSAIQITVTDDGQGDDSVSFHTSGWFRRTEPGTRTTDFARFGVGLANVQRVVEMHGGQVGAESAGPGRETRFFVTLPLVAPS